MQIISATHNASPSVLPEATNTSTISSIHDKFLSENIDSVSPTTAQRLEQQQEKQRGIIYKAIDALFNRDKEKPIEEQLPDIFANGRAIRLAAEKSIDLCTQETHPPAANRVPCGAYLITLTAQLASVHAQLSHEMRALNASPEVVAQVAGNIYREPTPPIK